MKKSVKKSAAARPKKRNPTRPRIPSTLVDIATALLIELEDGFNLKFPVRGDFALCSNRAGTQLWIVSRKKSKNVDATHIDSRAGALYETFTGFEHDSIGRLIHAKLTEFKRVGKALSIVYRSDKFSKPGKTADYIHSFHHYPSVSVDDPKRPNIVCLRGGRIRIRKEGITG